MTKSYSVPTKVIEDQCLIRVLFSRPLGDDETEIMHANFQAGKIVSDPSFDLDHALVNQLAYELQGAYDSSGIAGSFQIESIERGRGVDYDAIAKMEADDAKSRALRASTNALRDLLENPAISSALLEAQKKQLSGLITANQQLTKGNQEPRVAPVGGINEHH